MEELPNEEKKTTGKVDFPKALPINGRRGMSRSDRIIIEFFVPFGDGINSISIFRPK